MTHWEITRLVCYTISAPLLLWLALGLLRDHARALGLFMLSICLLFTWYMVDVTLVSSGASTRDTRNFATLLVVMATIGTIWMAVERYQWRRKRSIWRSK
ncbi:MAG: hypothetical protein KAX65_13310 [Caldilineaceae bacterium]|nr:hypothetical protein [Caldilineaceae bacterium]